MGVKKIIKKLFLFQEPEKIEKYILKETREEKLKDSIADVSEENSNICNKENIENANKGDKLGVKIIKKNKKKIKVENKAEEEKIKKEIKEINKRIKEELRYSLKYIKDIYKVPINGDIVIREFNISIKEESISAFAVFIDGMTDKDTINDIILKPLMILSNLNIKDEKKNTKDYIIDHLIPQTQIKISDTYEEVIEEVNFGGCGIFVDGLDIAFVADVKGWQHRGVERPNTELVIRGPQEGFTEVLRINTALVRKNIRDEKLIVEDITIGKRSKTACSILYIEDITNSHLIKEIRRRLNSIQVDYIIDSGELEQYLEDSTFLSIPQIIDTERPDRVALHLIEGRAAVLMNGTPFALIMPTNFSELLKSPEDMYIRYPYANFLRMIRILGVLITLLLPGLYIAIINYHHEMIPTDLMFAIEVSREKVPFPSIVELLIMEISFELIREAGLRVPGPIGPTLGIIGALILGQAAVAANIVSPILIIIVAVTGIGSFAIPNFATAFGIRIIRFVFIFLGAMSGFLGIATGIVINGLWFAAAKSFGIPFLVPFGPKVNKKKFDNVLRPPIWKQEWRPDYLNTQKSRNQSDVSRGWTKKKSKS